MSGSQFYEHRQQRLAKQLEILFVSDNSLGQRQVVEFDLDLFVFTVLGNLFKAVEERLSDVELFMLRSLSELNEFLNFVGFLVGFGVAESISSCFSSRCCRCSYN